MNMERTEWRYFVLFTPFFQSVQARKQSLATPFRESRWIALLKIYAREPHRPNRALLFQFSHCLQRTNNVFKRKYFVLIFLSSALKFSKLSRKLLRTDAGSAHGKFRFWRSGSFNTSCCRWLVLLTWFTEKLISPFFPLLIPQCHVDLFMLRPRHVYNWISK